jgi:hypothetical protein
LPVSKQEEKGESKQASKQARENSEEERDTSQETIRTIHEGMAQEKAHGSGRKVVPMP